MSEKYPSGKIVNMTVDNDRFQMTSQSLMKGAEVLQKYDYSYGTADLATGSIDATKNNGQLSKIEGWVGANKQWSQRFGYDELGRLKEAREYKQGDNAQLTYKQVFDFDRFGSLYRKAANNPTAGQANPLTYTAIEDSHISKSTNRFTSNTTYDDAGQVVNDAKFRNMSFGYDANGRQVKATRSGVPDAWTVYDALGNRVGTKVNDIWQYVIYDAFGKAVAEYGAPPEGLGGVKYVQQDWQGSVRTVTNNNGFVVSRTDHQAFGGEIGYGTGLRSIEQGYNVDKATRQGYGLTERDEATGLDHAWFRKNESSAGRWTSPDPSGDSMKPKTPQTFNRFSYVGGDPINNVDPLGLDRLDDAIASADWLLRSKRCADLFKGTNPQSFLRNTRISTPSRQPALYNSGGVSRWKAWANPAVAITSGRAKGIYINPKGPFFEESGELGIGFGIFLGYEDYSVLTLLHELAHVANVIPRDAVNDDQGRKNNTKIFVFCFLLNPEWRRDPVNPPSIEIGGPGITPRELEPLLQPMGWSQADWSFFLLHLLSASVSNSGGTVTVTGYCVNGQCY